MALMFSFVVFWMFCFPLFYSPVMMTGLLLFISVLFVSILSLFSSFWYSYILFLVYVGGLLVLFIYICLASSNFPLNLKPEMLIMILFLSFFCSVIGSSSMSFSFLGQSSWNTGEMLVVGSNLSIFVFLVVLLLMMLLVVVRVSGSGSSIVVNDEY